MQLSKEQRMPKRFLEVGALVIASLLLTGCAPGKRPFLMVQMCLSNQQGVEEFISELKSVASEEKLELIDNSRNAQQELKQLGSADGERPDGSRLIDIRLTRKDGMGLGAINVGLPGYQVAVGFAEGSSLPEAQQFANRTLVRFRTHWLVAPVPDGAGAQAMAGCR